MMLMPLPFFCRQLRHAVMIRRADALLRHAVD